MHKGYIIVHEDGLIALQNTVNDRIKEGYIPNGNMVIAVVKHSINPLYCQPMISAEILKCTCEGCKEESYGKC